MNLDMFGLILICLGLLSLLMTPRAIRSAEDSYYAMGWKVNMKIWKVSWIIGSITVIVLGALQIAGIIK